MSPYNLTMPSPIGALRLESDGIFLTRLSFGASFLPDNPCPVLEEAVCQLEGYFSGTRRKFDLPLRPEGTAFQKSVWEALTEIPYGRTSAYCKIARRIGNPNACRAVGMANHSNPIAIIIPCHRVVGKDGSLTGYAGGPEIKRYLLELEQDHSEVSLVEI